MQNNYIWSLTQNIVIWTAIPSNTQHTVNKPKCKYKPNIFQQTEWLDNSIFFHEIAEIPNFNGLFPFPMTDLDLDSALCNSCFHWLGFRFGSISQMGTVPITYISIRWLESESEPVDKSCIVQESMSESESDYESGSGNKPIFLDLLSPKQSISLFQFDDNFFVPV